MCKRSVILLILLFSFSFIKFAGANQYDLTVDVTCPDRVYLGEPFNFQVTIHNNSTATSHNYTLAWEIDGNNHSRVTETGHLEPNESVTLTSSYLSLLNPGNHGISIGLLEDGSEVYWDVIFIDVINVEAALIYSITPTPIYPNSTFTLTIELKNEGTDTIYDAHIRVLAIKNAKEKIQISSSPSFSLGNITSGASSISNYTFVTSSDVSPGMYNIPIYVYFWDGRGMLYEKYYYIPIEISSEETVYKLQFLELKLENDFQKLREDIEALQQNMIIITVSTIILIIAASLTNYWYTRRLAQLARSRSANIKK
jgi:hypothetical protein